MSLGTHSLHKLGIERADHSQADRWRAGFLDAGRWPAGVGRTRAAPGLPRRRNINADRTRHMRGLVRPNENAPFQLTCLQTPAPSTAVVRRGGSPWLARPGPRVFQPLWGQTPAHLTEIYPDFPDPRPYAKLAVCLPSGPGRRRASPLLGLPGPRAGSKASGVRPDHPFLSTADEFCKKSEGP